MLYRITEPKNELFVTILKLCLINRSYGVFVFFFFLLCCSIVCMFAFFSQRPQVPVQTFTVIAESVSTMRVAYLGLYCLEIKFRGGGLVTLRDAAYSRFDRTSVVNEFTPTPGLKVLQNCRLAVAF